jgi:hypothetical protein
MKYGLMFLLFISRLNAGAADPEYAGYYQGPTNVMAQGFYFFSDPANPSARALISKRAPFVPQDWRGIAFDGAYCYSFYRGAGREGPGLYKYDAAGEISLISRNVKTGAVYTFTNWHGLGYCKPFFYGLYDGTGMSGPGLYRFADPADPEKTAERLFASQTFPSDVWSEMDFDGARYLFVRTASGGTPGIYEYDPQTDRFVCISASETYADWTGLGICKAGAPKVVSSKKKLYVVLLGGQSNALGWGYQQYLLDTGHPLAAPQNDVELFTDKGIVPHNKLIPLQSGAGNPSVKEGTPQQYPQLKGLDAQNHFGPELTMGRTIRNRIGDPESKVAVIKYAFSNTSIFSDWLPDGTARSAGDGPYYRSFQLTVWNGLSALREKYPDYEIRIIGMGWVQGEADAASEQRTNYQANLTALIKDVRMTFGTNMVFAFSKLSPNQNASSKFTVVREAQDAVAATVPGAVATETLGTNYLGAAGFAEGSVHYLSSSVLQIGADLGNAIADVNELDGGVSK